MTGATAGILDNLHARRIAKCFLKVGRGSGIRIASHDTCYATLAIGLPLSHQCRILYVVMETTKKT